ncbi:MAG: hypothetical protein V3R55_04045, partial [Alphaproteobacteria bacterium]
MAQSREKSSADPKALSQAPGRPAAPKQGAPRYGPRGKAACNRDLDALRETIARLESGPALRPYGCGGKGEGRDAARRPVLPLGVAAIDARLPWGGLPAGALHEVIAGDVSAAATGFALALAALFQERGPARPCLWCTNGDTLYGPGFAAFGVDTRHLLLARGRNDKEVLWAAEEGLRSAALSAVFAEVRSLGLEAGRRLALAARESGVTAFLLRPFGASPAPSAAFTRWRVASETSLGEAPANGVGTPCWRLELLRCRNAPPAAWR